MKLDPSLARSLFASTAISPTERVLRTACSPEAIRAALEAGWLDVSGLMATSADPKPALAEWCQQNQFKAARPLDVHWRPEAGNGPAMVGADLSGQGQQTAKAMKAEWLAGWMIAHLPSGGLPTWRPLNPHHADKGFSFHLLGTAVANKWTSVVDQILRRADGPASWDTTLCAISKYTYLGGEIGNDSRCLPVLHMALSEKNDGLVERLLVEGLDPNALDTDGIPAVYYARTLTSVKLLLQYGLDPSRKPAFNESLVEWWAADLRSTEEAMRLMVPISEWLVAKADPQLLIQQKMPEIGKQLETLTLSGLKKQLSQLKIPSNATWEQDGQEWSLARKSLQLLLNADPFEATPAVLGFGLGKGEFGKPVLGEVPNECVLWLMSLRWPAAKERLDKTFRGFQPSTDQLDALGRALMEREVPPGKKTGSYQAAAPLKEKIHWIVLLAKQRFDAPENQLAKLEDHPSVALWDYACKHLRVFNDQVIVPMFGKTLQRCSNAMEEGDWEEAGQWLCQAVLLANRMYGSSFLSTSNKTGVVEALLKDPSSCPNEPMAKLLLTMSQFPSGSGKIGTDKQRQALDEILSSTLNGDALNAFALRWKQFQLDQGLTSNVSSTRRHRL